MNIALFSRESVSRNKSTFFTNSLYSISCSTLPLPETHSLNSSNTAVISPPPRLSTFLCLYLLIDKFLVIFPRKEDSTLGLWGHTIPCFHICIIDTFFCVFFTAKDIFCNRSTVITIFNCCFHYCLLVSIPIQLYYFNIFQDKPPFLSFHLYRQLLSQKLTIFLKFLFILNISDCSNTDTQFKT